MFLRFLCAVILHSQQLRVPFRIFLRFASGSPLVPGELGVRSSDITAAGLIRNLRKVLWVRLYSGAFPAGRLWSWTSAASRRCFWVEMSVSPHSQRVLCKWHQGPRDMYLPYATKHGELKR